MIYKVPRPGKKESFDLKLVDKKDEFLFSVFEKLFENIKKNDSYYTKSVEGNVFTFISEDYHEDDANMLQIEKKDDEFEIKFVKNFSPNIPLISKMCQICFCNSGSRVPNIERQFMLMFIELSKCDSSVQIEKE